MALIRGQEAKRTKGQGNAKKGFEILEWSRITAYGCPAYHLPRGPLSRGGGTI